MTIIDYEPFNRASINSKASALHSVSEMNFPVTITITGDSFLGLGVKTGRTANAALAQLSDVYGENLPYLLGYVNRHSCYAVCVSAAFIAHLVADGLMLDNDRTRAISTFDGCAATDGMALTLWQDLGGSEENEAQSTFRSMTPFQARISICDTLNAAAILWFSKAAEHLRAGNTGDAFDWLDEANSALSTAHGNSMWDDSEKYALEDNALNAESEARSALAKKAAHARHADTRAMKAAVFKWLESNIANYRSMDAAAEAITRREPIKFRTARDWVGEWKKQRSAGKP